MSWDQDVDKLVGESLRMLRTNADLTQGGLADRLSSRSIPMSQQTIAKIESGSRSLRLSEALAIVHALNEDDDDEYGKVRLEHLVAAPGELVVEEESQRIVDRIFAAADQLSAAAKEYTLYSLAGHSWLKEEAVSASGRASRTLEVLIKDAPTGLFNFVKAGIREALEEAYADEVTYRDAPGYVKPFLSAIGEDDDPAS